MDVESGLNDVVVIDTETGGLDPAKNAILTLALVSGAGREIEVRIADKGTVSPEALAVNGIDLASHMRDAEKPAAVVRTLSRFLSELGADPRRMRLAGHNVAFDVGFARRLYRLANAKPAALLTSTYRLLDTHSLLWMAIQKGQIPAECASLGAAAAHFGVACPDSERHTAIGDARMTLRVLRALLAL